MLSNVGVIRNESAVIIKKKKEVIIKWTGESCD